MPNPLNIIIDVNFCLFIPKKISIPPARPRNMINIPRITVSYSTPKVKGVKIPASKAAIAIMYKYFVPDRIMDFKVGVFEDVEFSANSISMSV